MIKKEIFLDITPTDENMKRVFRIIKIDLVERKE